MTRSTSLVVESLWTTQLIRQKEVKVITPPEKGLSSFQKPQRSASHEARGQKDSPAIVYLGIS